MRAQSPLRVEERSYCDMPDTGVGLAILHNAVLCFKYQNQFELASAKE